MFIMSYNADNKFLLKIKNNKKYWKWHILTYNEINLICKEKRTFTLCNIIFGCFSIIGFQLIVIFDRSYIYIWHNNAVDQIFKKYENIQYNIVDLQKKFGFC